MSDRLHCNRSRKCNCCRKERFRVQLDAPKLDDPHYKVAWCPSCDGPVPPKKAMA